MSQAASAPAKKAACILRFSLPGEFYLVYSWRRQLIANPLSPVSPSQAHLLTHSGDFNFYIPSLAQAQVNQRCPEQMPVGFYCLKLARVSHFLLLR